MNMDQDVEQTHALTHDGIQHTITLGINTFYATSTMNEIQQASKDHGRDVNY
jgi:hypothetical protein